MLSILRTATLSAALAIGGLAAMPVAAEAAGGGIYLGFGSGHGDRFGFRFEDRSPGHHRDYRGHERRGRDRGCSAREALGKAENMGLRRARIVREGPRSISVEGRMRGRGFAVMTFGRAPHCPLVR